ncbi:MAG TPA: rod shape-determining protein RodA [Candidatus Uhrbacteria bacterium]|nr:rod shape-determining protein RodA [Candidatus Uhrbacteria bacterium]
MKPQKLSLVFKKFDWLLLITVCLIVILGLILLYSIALGSQSEQSLLNFKKQAVFFICGLFIIFFIAFFIDYKVLIKYNAVLYALGVCLLVAVLFLGRTIRGTAGWIELFGWSFQPVELAKICLIIYLSKFLSDKAKYISQLKYLILSSLGAFLLVLLVFLQPDFGSAIILFALWLALVLITGIKKSHLFSLAVILVISSLVLWFFVFQDFQKERVRVFLNPELDPLGSGYNITQAMIAIGSGKVFGKGLAFGSQSQLKFLPESQTDFIFAVLAEELGFAGICLLFILFGFLFYRLIKIAKEAHSNFAAYLAVSILILFFIQLAINIGGNLGLLPITGITLPFLSYGGSSLIVNMVLVGVVESIAVRN